MTYYWIAKYNNGTEISSLDGNKYKNIDKGSLKTFVLLQVDNDKPVVTLEMGGNKRLILFKRITICSDGGKLLKWVVGHQELIQGRNVQKLYFVAPDGRMDTTDGFNEDHVKFARPSDKQMERFDG